MSEKQNHTSVDEAAINAVRKLIDDLNRRRPLSAIDAQALADARTFRWIDHGGTQFLEFSEESRSQLFDHMSEDNWNQPDAIRRENQNITWQIETFYRGMDDWFERGWAMPPHYADRITVLLRKSKLFELEKEFIKAYFRHFWSEYGGPIDVKLAERAIKIGIVLPSIPKRVTNASLSNELITLPSPTSTSNVTPAFTVIRRIKRLISRALSRF